MFRKALEWYISTFFLCCAQYQVSVRLGGHGDGWLYLGVEGMKIKNFKLP